MPSRLIAASGGLGKVFYFSLFRRPHAKPTQKSDDLHTLPLFPPRRNPDAATRVLFSAGTVSAVTVHLLHRS